MSLEKNKFFKFDFSDKKILTSQVIVALGALNNLSEYGILDNVRKESQHLIITDTNLEKLYLKKIIENMKSLGYSLHSLVIEASDNSKSLDMYIELVNKSLEVGFDKHSVVFSLGGGVVNNLSGFLASTLYRGIGLIHFPTSLLSQVDAAISFKQAINHTYGKNLIGSYYAASKIVIDPEVLKSLDSRFIKDGLAESVKHALCQDMNFLQYLTSYNGDLYNIDFLYHVISETIRLKMEVMDGDVSILESDYNESIKYYGHTIGHAIEHMSDGEFYHGEAISIGMCVSAEASYFLGYCDKDTVEAHYKVFLNLGLPTVVPNKYTNDEIWDKVHFDKHFLDEKSYFGLVEKIGTMSLFKNNLFGHYIDKEVLSFAIDANKKRS